MKKIVIIIPYFGKWPKWIEAYLLSCAANPTIRWHFFSDCGPLPLQAENLGLTPISWADYQVFVSRKLGVQFKHANPYKCCDLKPLMAVLHPEIVNGHEFWGFGDIDVIYGNLRHFFTEELLSRHDILTTHNDRLAGHLTLIRNTWRTNHLFRLIRDWRRYLETEGYQGMEEGHLTKMIYGPKWRLISFLLRISTYSHEQFSTILAPNIPWNNKQKEYPEEWNWCPEGLFVDDQGSRREMAYLHFMNWASHKYLSFDGIPAKPGSNAWAALNSLYTTATPVATTSRMTISGKGIACL